MSEDNPLFLVDSNVLIYAYDERDSDKKRSAEALLDLCWDGKARLAISNQNLAEFAYVSSHKLKLDAAHIKTIVEDIKKFNGFIKIDYSASTVIASLAILEKNSLPFWDALLIATMRENNIVYIYTENTKDFKIEGISAVNPFIKS